MTTLSMAAYLQGRSGSSSHAPPAMAESTSTFFSSFMTRHKRARPLPFSSSLPDPVDSSSVPSSQISFASQALLLQGNVEPKRRRVSSETRSDDAFSNRMLPASMNTCMHADRRPGLEPRCFHSPLDVFTPQIPSALPPFSVSSPFASQNKTSFDEIAILREEGLSDLSHVSNGRTAAESCLLPTVAGRQGGDSVNSITRRNGEQGWIDNEATEREDEFEPPTLLPRCQRGPGGGKAAAEMLRAYDFFYM